MLQQLPLELAAQVIGYLNIGDVQSLHSACKAARDLTLGKIELPAKQRYHHIMGDRIWTLEQECESLNDGYRKFKCRRPRYGGYAHANHHDDYEVFDKCIRISNGWHPGHVFTELRGVMDSVAYVEQVDPEIPGIPHSDVYYRRGGISRTEPLTVSEGPTFNKADLVMIMSYLKRLHALIGEIETEAIGIRNANDFYAGYPAQMKRLREVIERRIKWLHEKSC
jgi:hypothetical protein